MAQNEDGRQIQCDFCEAKIEKKDFDAGNNRWQYAHRGDVWGAGPGCRLNPKIKHSCPDTICQAKLLVWART